MKHLESNALQCKEDMKKLKKCLLNKGYNIIAVGDTIICKTPKSIIPANNSSSKLASSTKILNKRCTYINQSDSSQTKVSSRENCPYNNNCDIPVCDCPLNNNNGSGSGSESGSGSGSYPPFIYGSQGYYLIRIRPSDTKNALVMHVIILYGEHSDLKISFPYGDEGIAQIIEMMNFLI